MMPPSLPRVVFVCEHGAAKSVLAASWFNHFARKRQLAMEAIARGTSPDPAISPIVVAALDQEGIPRGCSHPEALRDSDLNGAVRVVTFDQPGAFERLPPGVPWDQWDGLPAISTEYPLAREAILARVVALLAELAGLPGRA